jgi:prevent-host-death family protein
VTTVNMHDAKTNLSKLVEAAENGETIIIARNGKPAALLVAATTPLAQSGWSQAMLDWFEYGEALEFEIDRSDLKPLEDRDLF